MRLNFKQKYGLYVLVLTVLIMACKSYSERVATLETATMGNIKIGVDESYQLLVDSQLAVFESTYKYAHIEPVYASEDSILKLFMADSIRLMITSRQLTDNEKEYLVSHSLNPRTTHIAWDAVTFVVNRSNPDINIRYNTIKDILTGDIRSWKQINAQSGFGNLAVVFDNQGSANVRYLMKKFNISTLPDYCYAASSNPAVIDYVDSHPNAIGIISVNWVSDPDDSITHAFKKRVNVIGISSEYYSEGDDFYTPHPAYIYDKSYPFVREVYAISRETFTGLGTGLIQFVSGDVGQRIVLKAGMVPAVMPVRLVQIRTE